MSKTSQLALAMMARFLSQEDLIGNGKKAKAFNYILAQDPERIDQLSAAFASAAERWAPMFELAARQSEGDAMLIAELDAKFSVCAGSACAGCEQRNECGDRKLREVYSSWRGDKKEGN